MMFKLLKLLSVFTVFTSRMMVTLRRECCTGEFVCTAKEWDRVYCNIQIIMAKDIGQLPTLLK